VLGVSVLQQDILRSLKKQRMYMYQAVINKRNKMKEEETSFKFKCELTIPMCQLNEAFNGVYSVPQAPLNQLLTTSMLRRSSQKKPRMLGKKMVTTPLLSVNHSNRGIHRPAVRIIISSIYVNSIGQGKLTTSAILSFVNFSKSRRKILQSWLDPADGSQRKIT
jgi:hypothetical protein